jgi:ParB-like chromosome segregation protein Spo0J
MPDGIDQTTLEGHPLADAFPLLEGGERTDLATDIRENGLREPIVLYEGRVLDGRNRLRACIEAGVQPCFVTYGGNDPVAYIVSLNLRRRHLDASQRAMIAARLATLKLGDNQHRKEGAGFQAPSQGRAAAMLNVSRDSVQKARVIVERGTTDLQRAVEAGRVSVSAASEIARGDETSQDRVLAEGDEEVLREAARLRRERRGPTVGQHDPDLFAGLTAKLPADAKHSFDMLIESIVNLIHRLDKLIADFIWNSNLSEDTRRTGVKVYLREVEQMSPRIKKLLDEAVATARLDQTPEAPQSAGIAG